MALRKTSTGTLIGRKEAPKAASDGSTRPTSWNAKQRTLDVVLSDERSNTITRHDWWSGNSIREQLSLEPGAVRLDRANNGAPFLVQHNGRDANAQIGKFVEGSVRVEGEKPDRQLVGTVKFSANLDEANERIVMDMADGIRRNISVGWREHETVVTKNADGPDHHFVADWEMFEGSGVTMGADDGAVTRAAAIMQPVRMERAAMPNENDTTGGAQPTEAEIQARVDAEIARRADVDAAAVKADAEREAHITAEVDRRAKRAAEISQIGAAVGAEASTIKGWQDQRDAHGKPITANAVRALAFDAAVTRQNDPSTQILPAVSASGSDESDVRGLRMVSYLLVHRAGFSPDEVRSAMVANDSKGRRFAGHGVDLKTWDFGKESLHFGMGHRLTDLARLCLEADGINTKRMGPGELIEHAIGVRGMQARGMNTTSSFPLLLAETLNTSLRIGFDEVPLTYLPWTRQRNAPDFRSQFNITMGEADALEVIGEKEEIPTSTMSEERESYALVEHGRIFGMTHRLMVNDRLGGLTQLGRKFGASGNRRMRQAVYDLLFLDTPLLNDGLAVFTDGTGATRSVNLEPTPSVVSIAVIDDMRVRMATRQGIRTDVTVPHPLRHLIVAEGRRTLTEQTLGLTRSDSRANGVGIATSVPQSFTGLQVHSDPLIDADNAGNGIGQGWYGTNGEAIQWAFLEGEEGVQLAVQEDFDRRGMKIRATLDFGCGVVDWRGLDKNAGAAA